MLLFFPYQTCLLDYSIIDNKSSKKLGENVEPVELEEAAMGSPVIQHIVVVGQVEFNSFSFNCCYFVLKLSFMCIIFHLI